jgi:hypothetical protein
MSKLGYETILGFCAETRGEAEFFVSKAKLECLSRCGPETVYYNFFSAAEVLRDPQVVFSGLQRSGQEAGMCYSARARKYRDGAEMPGPPGFVMCAYTTVKRVLYEWRWEKEAEGQPGWPIGWDRDRFGGVIWKR